MTSRVSIGQGEEFRDDVRKRLPPEVLARHTRIDPLRSSWAVAQTALLIALAVGLTLHFKAAWSLPIAVVFIATQQHALFVLAHDGAHYRLFETRWLNDLVGRLCGTVGGVSMCTYRVIHRLHHNDLYGPQDPDIALHGGYPRGKAYLLKKLGKDLLGLTAWKTYAYFFGTPAINADNAASRRPLNDTSPRLRAAARQDRWVVLLFHGAAPVAAFAAGYGWQYAVLWMLPLLTVLPALLRLRAICEHGAVSDTTSPLTAARTNLTPWWLRGVLFPHHVNYHIEHHLYPAVPHYRLPALHADLAAHGILDGAEVRRLADTLARIFAPRPGRSKPAQ